MLVLDGNSGKHIPILYSQSAKGFVDIEETELLDLLECDDGVSPALVKADEVEKTVNYVVRKWCQMNNKNIGLIRKVCAMVFSPKGHDLLGFLNSALKDMEEDVNPSKIVATQTRYDR